VKKVILYLTALLLLSVSCKPNCEPKIPKGVKPIDWENYNDVYTVKWNFTKECTNTNNDTGRDIKVFGWIFQGTEDSYPPVDPEMFPLIDKKENIFAINCSVGTSFYIRTGYFENHEDYINLIDSLKIKFATSDITKKCYVSGKLSGESFADNKCCWTDPVIIIDSVDDIYFEEE